MWVTVKCSYLPNNTEVFVWVIRKINGDIQLQQSAATASGTCGLIISAQIKNKATL